MRSPADTTGHVVVLQVCYEAVLGPEHTAGEGIVNGDVVKHRIQRQAQAVGCATLFVVGASATPVDQGFSLIVVCV